ncbi:hypothetical protein AB1E22_08145 [Buttiauxella gaviniae]|uniref:DUF4435 domain-containing protein n=1 Tax=Buttiauxella gaviniae TaxID=82990 RepID=A0ABV3NT60_9ENTR
MFCDHITPDRTANAIIQDKSFNGYYLFIEGIKDLKTYKKLMSKDVKLQVTFGKHNMRKIKDILQEREYKKFIGIRDADFLRLEGNEKFDNNYNECIFPTDEHDSEGMIINSDALYDFIDSVSNEKNIALFTEKYGEIRNVIYELCYPLACLRLANKKNNLGLAFKPVKPEGNKFKIKKFISEENFSYLGHEKMINTIVEYSTNRGGKITSREQILSCLTNEISSNHDIKQIINGHDIAEVLYLISKKGLKSLSKTINDSGCVEEMLRLAYNYDYFSTTSVFKKIISYQNTNGIELLR